MAHRLPADLFQDLEVNPVEQHAPELDPVQQDAPEAPASVQEDAPADPAFDPVLVRDFYHYLLVGIHGGVPETSVVSNFLQTAALGLHFWSESGVLVLVPAVKPIADAIPMSKLLKRKINGNAEWEVTNITHLELVADVSKALFKLRLELMNLCKMLKDMRHLKNDESQNANATQMRPMYSLLSKACDKVDSMIPAVIEAGLAVLQLELRRDTLAVADVAKTASSTVRQAVLSKSIVPSRPYHRTVKEAYRALLVLLKDTPVDFPIVNPFDV